MDITNYKKTSVGFIPIDWDFTSLGDISQVYDGTHMTPDYKESGVPFFSVEHLTSNNFIKTKFISREVYEKEIKRTKIEKGDILMTRIGDIGTVKFIDWDIEASFYVSLALLKNKSNNDFKFLSYQLQSNSFKKELDKRIIHVAFPIKINLGEIGLCLIVLPPINEQRKIATILSNWDLAINNCKAVIENLKNRNIGLAQQLLSGKIRVKGFEKSQWHLKSVEEVAVFKNGKAHENCIDEEGDYFVVNSKFISTQGKIAKASNENLCPLFKNDITMVMSDIPNGKAFAKCFYIPEDDKYTLNQRICALTARKGTDSRFLYYQMNRNNYYLAFNNGVSQTNLKKDEVLECPLLIPDIEEQIQIVKLIDTATEELNQYQQKLEALQLQKKGLMQQLLTGKTRVKI